MTDKNYDPYYAKDGSNTAPSLRDKFTMAAMQGDLASQDENTGYYENITPDEYLTARDEFYCRIADAMLRAREK